MNDDHQETFQQFLIFSYIVTSFLQSLILLQSTFECLKVELPEISFLNF